LPGDALVVTAQATADGLDIPIRAVGGAIVDDPAAARATVNFVPSRAARLTSPDGRVTVNFPAGAAKQPLRLSYRSLPAARADARTTPLVIPESRANNRRGFAPFFLTATNEQGNDVHRFDAPLTLTIHFTPQQLQALNLSAASLALYWFDETAPVTGTGDIVRYGDWVPLPTTIDAVAGTATVIVDHFSGYQLSDDSSASSAYLPSTQTWQTSMFTGAASSSYPLAVPAAAGGMRPPLALTYSSSTTDGPEGMNPRRQGSWVGKGWSLDTGSIALNKVGRDGRYYAVAFGGQSFDLVRAEALVGSPDPKNPSHWAWRPTDENFVRVRVYDNGASDSTRGGFVSDAGVSTWQRRYRWVIWTKDGTRYEFSEDLWWGFYACEPNNVDLSFETYKWLLSKVVDPSNNTITYAYGRLPFAGPTQFCSEGGQYSVQGVVDQDAWPLTITWGANTTTGAGDRYRVTFQSSARTTDTAFDDSATNLYEDHNGQPRETRRLDAVKVETYSGSAWEVTRRYNLEYYNWDILSERDQILYSDDRVCLPTCGPNTNFPKLTLKRIAQVGKDETTALPWTTFTYETIGGSGSSAAAGWNRLKQVNNGQGGTVTYSYANIATVTTYGMFINRHRVTSRALTDGRGNTYTWNYTYGTPKMNGIGSTLDASLASGWTANSANPTSAVIYYNSFLNTPYRNEYYAQMAHAGHREFRGHADVMESAPDGTQTKHYFRQGDAPCGYPVYSGTTTPYGGPDIIHQPCFKELRDYELLKGREYRTEVRTSGGTLLQQINYDWRIGFKDYGPTITSGLWRGFGYQAMQQETMYGAQNLSRTTRTIYQAECDTNADQTLTYGNPICIDEEDQTGTRVRRTRRSYAVRDDSAAYLADRMKHEAHYNSAGNLLSLKEWFYDTNHSTIGTLGTRGLVTLERAYRNVPLAPSTTGATLYSRDTAYGYDSYGNRTTVTTYTGEGTRTFDGTNSSYTGPFGTARTTTTSYDDPNTASDQANLGLSYSITNPLNHIERAEYDVRLGALVSINGPNADVGGTPDCKQTSYSVPATSDITCAQYDVFGRLRAVIKPGDSTSYPTVQVEYKDSEQPFRYVRWERETAGVTDQGRVTQQWYDGLGRLIQTSREAPGSYQAFLTDTRYDGLGRVIAESQPRTVPLTSTSFYQYTAPGATLHNATTTAYDALGRVTTVTAPNTTTTTTSYSVSGLGVRADTTDANNHCTRREHDMLGRLRTIVEYSGTGCSTPVATTQYSYDPLDQLILVTDALGNVTTLGYDTLGRKTTMSDPDMGAWSYTYDANGNLKTQTDAKAQVLWFGYDALDRLTERRVTNSAGTLRAQFAYDAGAYGIGQRTSMSAGSASTTWQYDARGRKTQAAHVVNGTSRTFGWQYDSGDRVAQTTYPSGDVVTHGYDAAWRPTSLSGTLSGSVASNGSYDALGQLKGLTYGNGSLQQWQYDPVMARLSSLQVGVAATPSSFLSLSYGYDAAGNIDDITDVGRNEVQNFSYDHRDRLTRAWTTVGGSGLQQRLTERAELHAVGWAAPAAALHDALVADVAALDQTPHVAPDPLVAAVPPTGPPLAPPANPSGMPSATALLSDTLARLPLQFVENRGQTDRSVRFFARGGAGTLFVTPDEAVLATPDTDPTIGLAVVRLQFLGARPQPAIRPRTLLPGVVNYFLGDNPQAWQANLPTYDGVVYQQLYPGVDVHYEGTDGQLKRTYHVAPGANPSQIAWRYQGATDVTLDARGNLLVTVPAPKFSSTAPLTPTAQVFRTLVEQAPVAWQDVGGQRVPVMAQFVVAPNKSVSLALGSYDPALPLVIDPVLHYNRTVGGSGADEALAITVNAAGEAYLVGSTGSVDFPTQNPQQPSRAGGADAFVSKLSANGSGYIWSTYLGGSADDKAAGVALDTSGRVAVVGETESSNFPRVNAYDTSYGGNAVDDVFVTQLAADGSSLRYSTYLGGSGDDEGTAIAVDSAGNLLLTGRASSGYPTTASAYDTSHNGSGTFDMLLTRINPGASGASSLLYSTFIGASSNERAYAIAVDANNIAYLVGSTFNTGFPTLNAYDSSHNGNADVLVVKLNPAVSGTAGLLYSSYYGGSGAEEGFGIAVDASGNAYVTGYTGGTLPTATPYQAARAGGNDAFVAKLSTPSSGSGALLYGTYLGGTADEYGTAIVQDGANSVSLTGWTRSNNYPTAQPTQASRGGDTCTTTPCRDAIVSQLNLGAVPASQLVFSTYLGGGNEEEGRGIARASNGTLFVSGVVYVSSPTGSQSNAFASAINLSSLFTPAPYDESYAYDTLGNLTNKGGVAYQYGANGNGTGAGPHQARVVSGQTYSYDQNGSLTSGGGRTLSWDVENRLSSVASSNGSETYAYDADGERVSVTRGGVTTLYLEGVWEEVVGGASKTHYLLGSQLIAVRDNGAGTVTYLHADHLGSVSLATGSGPVVQSRQYFTPWGSLRAGSVTQTTLNYTGQRLDASGLLYYHARYYDPVLARFVSADTIVPGAGSLTLAPHDAVAASAWAAGGGGPANAQDLNRYSYGLNNPVKNTDPTGHCSSEKTVYNPRCTGQTYFRTYAPITSSSSPSKTNPAAQASAAGATRKPTVITSASPAQHAAEEGATNSGNLVYRGLRPDENPTNGLSARAPGAQNVSPASHVAGKRESPWISTTKDREVAITKYGEHGVVEIDLSKIKTEVVDLSNGIPGTSKGSMISNWAKHDREVLIRDYIPPDAIRGRIQ
jgi:RHS repeat-associated protein